MLPTKPTKFVILAILDGWGIAPDSPGNAISLAKAVNIKKFSASFPHGQLRTSGDAVGLPRGEKGNTETGHLNLGAGRIVYQDLLRINMAIADGSFYENPAFQGAFQHATRYNSNLHLIGLIGAGGVHSNIDHLFALLNLAKRKAFKRVYLHLITDGRDSPPASALTYINHVRNEINKEGVGIIASIMGRYWAMDRDFRWERTAKAYLALTQGTGECHKSPEDAINASYTKGVTDEFINPCMMSDDAGKPFGMIKDNDAVIFYNFRIDRPRQLSAAFIMKDFSPKTTLWGFDTYRVKYGEKHVVEEKVEQKPTQAFERGRPLENLYFAIMTDYGKPLTEAGAIVAFPPERIANTLGQVISESGLRQLRITESEKERFVTFYFNGQREPPFQGEERIIIPSPKVSTYDQKPEMAAKEITNTLLQNLQNTIHHSFILINFANPDMVAHTGNIGATVKACEVVDDCIGKIANYVTTYGGTFIITADHGNAEELIDIKSGSVDTDHSDNDVPIIIGSRELLGNHTILQQGILADVAPTVLSLLKLNVPSTITGRNLLTQIWNK